MKAQLADYIYKAYPQFDGVVKPSDIQVLLEQHPDKFIYGIGDNGEIIGCAFYLRLTDYTFERIDGFDMSSSLVMGELLRENGPNIHFIQIATTGFERIMRGLRDTIERTAPKTISWYSPHRRKLNILKIGRG